MVRPHDLVVSLHDLDKDDSLYVGGKAANLGEMIEAKFPVPPGFVITANAYVIFLKENQLDKKIQHLLSTVNFERDESLNQVSKEIKKLIRSGKIPQELVDKIFTFYEKLGKNVYVAIRSSATGEDSKQDSFAGQNETFLNVRGEAVLADKVREAWSSLFSPRSLFYRHERKIKDSGEAIALVVQKMVESEVSGVMFTVDPVTSDKSKIIVEAIFGLGEYIVQGKVTPDHYEVDKKKFEILERSVKEQRIMLKKFQEANKEVGVPFLRRRLQKLTDYEIIALSKLGAEIEKHYYFPQDIEWAKEKDRIFIVQTRPVTTLRIQNSESRIQSERSKNSELSTLNSKLILVGDPASPGIATGYVRKVSSPKNISIVKQDDVLVAVFTNPDFVPAMKRASAIITEKGGRTSHAAIVAREFGIPAVVGAPLAMKKLKDGEAITVNGTTGEIFRGGVIGIHKENKTEDKYSTIKTATKLLVNIAEPELAQQVASKNVDGVGLLRAEFMIAKLGVHPKKMIRNKKSKEFTEKLAEGISTICSAFYPRPVLYRATDFKSNEYRNLVGGKEFEPIESNPMIGYRGAFRYIHDPEVFKLELAAIKIVREKNGLNNLNLMIPFVRTVRELEEVKKIISSQGLRRSHTFKLFMMVEIPSNVILIEDFIKAGIDGVSIGSNDLTMLLLGIDRDNEEIAFEFDERNPAVLWALKRVIQSCNKLGVSASICGQAPSVFPGLVEQLVEWGIESISVSPDAIDNTRRIIYFSEGRLINKGR